ncbi:MAG TPA: YrhB domain-containing protein [Pseudonocardiaceae bacterium]|jgi:hypothetical protein|nr:YrhB domain-containing protein [Pseudonocardiaceae bacterium]
MTDPGHRAASWLGQVYGGLVILADPEPFAEGERNWLFGCRWAEDLGRPTVPMLSSTIAVPKSGLDPFPVGNADPLDEDIDLAGPAVPGAEPWRWRINARNCLVATDAAIDHRPATALPWRPTDETPDWWGRLLSGHFPGAAVSTCANWAEVCSAIVAGGPGTRGVVWLQRQFHGVELTGHLLYAQYRDGAAVVLDGQQGTVAVLDDEEVQQLILARFNRQDAPQGATVIAPWQRPATDLPAAIDKANQWLASTYDGGSVLVDPDPADETARGWLFACTTRRFQQTHDWQDQMLDAALVVPKAAGEAPFGLPNPDPWTWLAQWDEGDAELPDPPDAGAAVWFEPTMRGLGPVLSSSRHQDWAAVLGEIADFPPSSRALVWVRRQDGRGRETVGNLLLASTEPGGVQLVDALMEGGQPVMDEDPLGLHVIRYA